MPNTSKLVFITRPIAFPWDEGSKNLTLILAKKIRIPNLIIYLLTTQRPIKSISKNIMQLPLFSNPKLTIFNKFKILIFLIGTNANIFHFIFAATPITSIIIKLILFLKRKKSLQTIVSLDNYFPSLALKLMIYGNQIVCLSKTTAQKIRKAGFSNVHIIPPGVDMNIFLPLEKKNAIAFLGELYRMESYSVVKELLPLIAKAFPSYTIILGFRFSNKLPQEYELREKLKSEIGSINAKIVWRDVIENMPRFLGNAKLVILPAINMRGKFDFPLVLLESLASGTPIIVSPINPLIELAQYEGVKTPSSNSALSFMETVIESLNENSYNELSQAARKTAAKHFSIQKITKQYEKIYERLIAG